HLKIIPIIVIEFLERLDQQEVDGKPDGAAPVGVATEDLCARLRRFIAHCILGTIKGQHIGMSSMILTERTNAVITQKFLRIEHASKQALETMPTHQRQQATCTRVGLVPMGYQPCQVGPICQNPVEVSPKSR